MNFDVVLPGNDTGGTRPFEGSEEIASIVTDLIAHWCIQTFVETGTQRGATSLWAAMQLPRIITIEADPDYFAEATRNLVGSGVLQFFGDSAKLIPELHFNEGERVLFFLDAHGCRIGGTPLIQELLAIRDHVRRSQIHPVIAIHDVQVPGHPELGYDTYENGALTVDFIKDALYATAFGNWHLRYNSIADGAARGFCYVTSV